MQYQMWNGISLWVLFCVWCVCVCKICLVLAVGVFVAVLGLCLVAASGSCSLFGCPASHCSDFSCCWAWALGTWASGALLLEACWIFPDQGLILCPPALAGIFLTARPSGKPVLCFYLFFCRKHSQDSLSCSTTVGEESGQLVSAPCVFDLLFSNN